MLTGTGSVFDVVWPGKTDEFYRMEGTVCTGPREITDESGEIVIGMLFSFAKLGDPCETHARSVLVTVGRTKTIERTRRLKINQRVVVTGTLEGPEKEVLLAIKMVPNRR
ncbi:MAG: hypothetical protein GY856_26065 [bacterium]|nr:hypothetical protein [bacterium]